MALTQIKVSRITADIPTARTRCHQFTAEQVIDVVSGLRSERRSSRSRIWGRLHKLIQHGFSRPRDNDHTLVRHSPAARLPACGVCTVNSRLKEALSCRRSSDRHPVYRGGCLLVSNSEIAKEITETVGFP